MAIAFRTIVNTGDPITGPGGEVFANCIVTFTLVPADGKKYVVTDFVTRDTVVTKPVSVTLDENGILPVGFELWPTDRGNVDCVYKVQIVSPYAKYFYIKVNSGETELTLSEARATYINSIGVPISAVELYEDLTSALTVYASPTKFEQTLRTSVTLTENTEIPENVVLEILNGGLINLAGFTLNVLGSIKCGNYQVFTGTGAVTGLKEARPEWFGALPSASGAVNSAAIQAAIDSLPTDINFLTKAIGGVVTLGHGRYTIATKIALKRGIAIEGQGPEATQIIVSTLDGAFSYTDVGNHRQDKIVFRNIGIVQDAAVTPTSGAGIELLEGALKSQSLIVDNVYINGTYHGIRAQGLIASTISNSRISYAVANGIRIDGTVSNTSIRLSDSYVDLSGEEGVYVDGAAYITVDNFASDSNTEAGYWFSSCKGLLLNGIGAEQNAGSYGQIFIQLSSGVVINGAHMITDASDTTNHGIYLGSNTGAILINSMNIETTSGNTGYAIATNGQTQPIVVNTSVFGANYTSNQVYNRADTVARFQFNNCRMSSGTLAGLHNQVFRSTVLEGTVYASPGSIVQAPENAEGATLSIKHFGYNSPLDWYSLIGFRFATSTPSTGNWTKGLSIAWNSDPATGEAAGWVCTVSGSFGTLTAITGDIASGSAKLTVNSATGVSIGRYITIAGVTGAKRIIAITGLVATLDSVSDATVTGAAVQYQAPTLKGFGTIL